MADPVNSGQYSSFMVAKYDETNKVQAPTAFQGGFFNVPGTGAQVIFGKDTKQIEIDIMRADSNRMARLIHRGMASEDITRTSVITAEQFTNDAMPWPLIESPGAISSTQLFDRIAGETPFQALTREDRLSMLAMKIHTKHINEQIELHEYLCRQSVLEGSHPMILGTTNTDLIYDFHRKATHTHAATAKWDQVGTDIIGQLDTDADLIQNDDHYYGDLGLLVGAGGIEGIRKNTQIKAEADIRNFGLIGMGKSGLIAMPPIFERFLQNGFKLAGWLKTYENRDVYVFTYDRTFKDDFTTPGVTTTTKWMPNDKALMFNPTARCDKYFGPPDRMPITDQEERFYQEMFGFDMTAQMQNINLVNEGVIDPRVFFMDAKGTRKAVQLFTQSAPIFPSTETDAFVTITEVV